MNVLFFSPDQMSKFYCRIANELRKNNNGMKVDKFYYLTLTDLYRKYILDNSPGGNTEIINIYKDFKIKKVRNYDFNTIKRYEELYGIPNLWLYVITDRRFDNLPLNKIYDVLCWHLDFFENLFNKIKIDLTLSGYEGGFVALSLKRVADYCEIPNLYIGSGRIPNRVIITNNLYLFPINFEDECDKLRDKELSEDELKKAKKIISMYREERAKPSFFETYSTVSEFSGLLKIFKKIKKYYLSGLKNVINFLDIIKFSTYARKIRFYYNKIIFSKLFEKPSYKENYFFFPLHYQPEIAVDLMAPYYKDQKIIIDFVSKSLPAGYYLYVKEHPHAYGIRPIRYYKKILKNPRVKLIKTEENTYNLIENCSGIITLTGTVGWEAYILKKPVIVFGNVFYKFAKENVYFVDDIYKLPHILKEALENNVPNEDNLLKFCYAYYSNTYPGIIGPPSEDPCILSDENIKNICNAVVSEYNKIKSIDNKING